VPRAPVPRVPVPAFPVLEFVVPGIPVPAGRAGRAGRALAATRRMGRGRECLAADPFRSPNPVPFRSRTPVPALALAPAPALVPASGQMAAARVARRGADGRGRRAPPERRGATARGAGPHHVGGSPAVAPCRGAAAGPPGMEPVAGRPGSRRAGRPRLASSAPGTTWAAEAAGPPDPAVVPSRGPARRPGTLRPGIRAAVERSPWGAGRPRGNRRTPGAAPSPGGRRTREIRPRLRSPAGARREERRSGHLANTRSSVSALRRAPGPPPGTPPPGAGARRADGGATFRSG
jgi:hypothetical protein